MGTVTTIELRGRVIRPGDHDYDEARRVWNGMIDRHPALIARCADVTDVVAAVHHAREHDLPLAVRGGGHNVSGTAVCDDGIVIDLSPMREVRVDPERRTVWAQGGCTWGDVDRATQPYGLAVAGGVVSETGIAGLTLAGGYSYQRRTHGMSIDNVVGFEIVTADGRHLRASADDHPDLYWALRGGGGNFGVVTAFEYRAQPLGPEVHHALVFYPAERGAELMAAWRDAVEGGPDEVTSEAGFWSFPAAPEIPVEMHGMPFFFASGLYAGPPDEGERALRPLRELAEPLMDGSATTTYLELQSSLDAFFPAGRRYYWKGRYLDRLDGEGIDLIAERAAMKPSPMSLIIVRQLGGAIARVPADATAFGDRSAPFHLSVDSTWESPEHDEENIAWTRAFYEDARRFSSGQVYFNFAGLLEEGEAAVRESYGQNLERLVDVKTAYDPENAFRFNANITPRR